MRPLLESKHGAQNVSRLDGFVSLGKSNVTKKEFSFVRDENSSDA